MRKMQDVILEQISKDVKAYDLELVVNFRHSNTGTAYILDGIETILYFDFNFQTDYCSIIIYEVEKNELKKYSYLEYVKVDKLKELINFINDYCMEYDIEKQQLGMN